MARQSRNSLFGSLRGKIWISTSVLAFFICTFGLISYLVVSLLINDAFYGVFIPFLFLAFTVMIFGWWLSNEVVNPIENVTLLAKSLERSTSTSIPRTSGSAETDQLLQTIQRNNQQMQKIMALMDKVSNGNIDVAQMQGSDRLSISFQKLLTKVSESIHAKDELDSLKTAINDLKMETTGIRTGNLDVAISSNAPQTREISETIKYLAENLSRLIRSIRDGAEDAEAAVDRVDTDLGIIIRSDETRIQEMSEASIALRQVPNLINKITEDLMSSAKAARGSIEKARHGNEVSGQNSAAVGNLRQQVREAGKRIQNLNERSHDIERVAKTVEDLANRTNMIALNASIQATELGENGHGFVLVAEEVERLAVRANGTNKQISTLNKSILSEIGKVENSVESTMGEVASLSKFAIETANVLGEMERYVAHFLNLQENLIAYSKDQSEETDQAFATFADSITETEKAVATLKSSSTELAAMSRLVKELRSAVGEFRVAEEIPKTTNKKNTEGLEPDSYIPPAADESVAMDSDQYTTESFNEVRMNTAEFEEMTTIESDDENFSAHDEYQDNQDDEPDSADEFDSDGFELDLDEPVVRQAADESSDDIDALELSSFEASDPGSKGAGNDEKTGGDSNENGVFDLYEASMSHENKKSVFDSGEFASDELIEEIDPETEPEAHPYSAAETNVIEAGELEDLFDPSGTFESNSENELGAQSQ